MSVEKEDLQFSKPSILKKRNQKKESCCLEVNGFSEYFRINFLSVRIVLFPKGFYSLPESHSTDPQLWTTK